jgi:hypothetical protein
MKAEAGEGETLSSEQLAQLAKEVLESLKNLPQDAETSAVLSQALETLQQVAQEGQFNLAADPKQRTDSLNSAEQALRDQAAKLAKLPSNRQGEGDGNPTESGGDQADATAQVGCPRQPVQRSGAPARFSGRSDRRHPRCGNRITKSRTGRFCRPRRAAPRRSGIGQGNLES